MKQTICLLLIAAGITANSHACINGETQVLKNGTIITIDYEGQIVPNGHTFFDAGYYVTALKDLDRLWKKTKDIDYLSDYGVVLILQNKYEQAKLLYLQIEKLKPNRYSTASNIGTVYELLGQNEKALEWIKKAVQIDSTSHRNSEWLHVKILEAKIRGDNYITSNFLLNTDFGVAENPQTTLSREQLLILRAALYYQLNERISFIKPTNKIVALLLFDLGNIAYLTNAKSEALQIYKKSEQYGFKDSLIKIRSALISKIPAKNPVQVRLKSNMHNNILWLRTIVAVAALLAIVIVKFKKKSAN